MIDHELHYFQLALTKDNRVTDAGISVKGRDCQYHTAARLTSKELAIRFKSFVLPRIRKKYTINYDICIDEVYVNWTEKRERRVEADSNAVLALLNG